MRGRILLTAVALLGAAAMIVACNQRDSLYIEPGKAQPPEHPSQAAQPPRR